VIGLVCMLSSILAISPSVFSLEIQRIPSTGSPPAKRQLSSMAHDPIDNTLYLYGGLEESGEPLDEMWSFNLDSNTWEQIFTPSVVTPGKRFMSYLYYIASERAILLYGGSGPRGAVSDLWKFDIVTRMVRYMQWSYVDTKGIIPIPSMHPYITEYTDAGKRYLAIIAGLTRFGTLNKIYTLDLETLIWSELAVSGHGPDLCKLGTISFVEDTFYVFEPVELTSHMMKMLKLSLKDKVWERTDIDSFIENAVVDFNSITYDKYIYLMPGVDHEHSEDIQDAFRLKIEELRDSVVRLEAAKMLKNQYIHARSSYAKLMVNEILYIFGGLAYEGLLNELVKVEICKLNLANEALKFEILSKDIVMPAARREHAMEIYDEKLYIFGGAGKNDVL
jgi:N-acetylneuraminic acid mutarotase